MVDKSPHHFISRMGDDMKGLRAKSTSDLWQILGIAAVELMRRRRADGFPELLVRETPEGPQATINVALEPAQDGIPPLLALGNATLNPRFLHHLEAFPIHHATASAINRNVTAKPVLVPDNNPPR
jgi:hypothetical protein